MFRSRLVKLTCLLFIASLLLSACGDEKATETPVPTEVPPPTSTPVPSPTMTMTDTPVPPPPTAAPPVEREGIVGAYTAVGTNPDGSGYEGTLDVTANGDVFHWAWDFDGEYLGVGIQQENVVSVAWGGDECYVVSYIIQEDGVISGLWAGLGESAAGTDIATPTDNVTEGDIAGTYNILGADSGGGEYGCMLEVIPDGDVYQWNWTMCGEFNGVGIREGNSVSVAYGSENCSAISYVVEDDGTLNGTWVYVGTTDLGTDVATPSQ